MDVSRHEDVKEGGDICEKKKKCDGPYMISKEPLLNHIKVIFKMKPVYST